MMEKRHYLLGLLLIATITASIFINRNNIDEGVVAVEHSLDSSYAGRGRNSLQVEKNVLARRQWKLSDERLDLFEIKTQDVVTMPNNSVRAVTLPPPLEPEAPPLPFVYLGRLLEDGKATWYVSNAGRNYILRGGEQIVGVYSVLSVDSEKVVFQYDPLKIEQVLFARGIQ